MRHWRMAFGNIFNGGDIKNRIVSLSLFTLVGHLFLVLQNISAYHCTKVLRPGTVSEMTPFFQPSVLLKASLRSWPRPLRMAIPNKAPPIPPANIPAPNPMSASRVLLGLIQRSCRKEGFDVVVVVAEAV